MPMTEVQWRTFIERLDAAIDEAHAAPAATIRYRERCGSVSSALCGAGAAARDHVQARHVKGPNYSWGRACAAS
jgi:hypothetical protein